VKRGAALSVAMVATVAITLPSREKCQREQGARIHVRAHEGADRLYRLYRHTRAASEADRKESPRSPQGATARSFVRLPFAEVIRWACICYASKCSTRETAPRRGIRCVPLARVSTGCPA
jgi:hypothetical protein